MKHEFQLGDRVRLIEDSFLMKKGMETVVIGLSRIDSDILVEFEGGHYGGYYRIDGPANKKGIWVKACSLNLLNERIAVEEITKLFHSYTVYKGDGAELWHNADKKTVKIKQGRKSRTVSVADIADLPSWASGFFQAL